MAIGDAYVFPGFLTPVPTQLFFPKPPTTYLTCLCRGVCSDKSPGNIFLFGKLFYSLQNDKILDVTKLKAFADKKLNVIKMTIFL